MDLAMPDISMVAATGGTSGLRSSAGIHGLERRDDKVSTRLQSVIGCDQLRSRQINNERDSVSLPLRG
jgi:hypothetical protein